MSIRNYYVNISITNLITGDVETIYNFYRYSSYMRKELLEVHLFPYLENKIPFKIDYIYSSTCLEP